VLSNSEAVSSLLGWNLLSGGEAVLTHRAVTSARTVAVRASAHPLQVIITHARSAVMGLYAACAQYTVTRRAALETDRGVSLPAPCVSGRPHLLTWARPIHLPH
jgi:hypothetical protein